MPHPVPPPAPFAVETTACGTAVTLGVAGELDLVSTGTLRDAVDGALRGSPEILAIDLGAVTFVDSSGVRLLAGVSRRAIAHGVRLVLVPGPADVQRTFALCGMLDVLPFAVVPVDAAAVAA